MKTAILDIFLNLAMVLMVAYGVLAANTGRGERDTASIASLAVWVGTDRTRDCEVQVTPEVAETPLVSTFAKVKVMSPPALRTVTLDDGWLRWEVGEFAAEKALQVRVVFSGATPARPADRSDRDRYVERMFRELIQPAADALMHPPAVPLQRTWLLQRVRTLIEHPVDAQYALPQLQAHLRARLLKNGTGEPSSDQLAACAAAAVLAEYFLLSEQPPVGRLIEGEDRRRGIAYLLARFPFLRPVLTKADHALVKDQPISGLWGGAFLLRGGAPQIYQAADAERPPAGEWRHQFPPYVPPALSEQAQKKEP